ncbi:PH domain-containing protein [Modestobacter sp. Leaf380]|uniref:PH domain-containing protein n=1 Tax=Modestobacter sp. Leaf380 TaxID=1736356 RepID=UPI000701F498|nr:PH domain-containing protein [Modestobacter sp. Leaf380]KQS66867.1 hypothetical protein ASG41_10705 [Modestobacter sp. Leaf380]
MQWSTRLEETTVAGLVAVGLAVAALVVDPVGRFLVGAAAVLLVAVVVRDLVLRPRVRAEDDGVHVRTTTGTTVIGWPALRVQVHTTRRLGLRSTTLELEDARDDTVLVVLGRRDLGVDPAQVAAALQDLTARPSAQD